MKKIKITTLSIFLLLQASAQEINLVDSNTKRIIDSTYNSLIKIHKVKGTSIAIVDQGKIVFAKGYGMEDELNKIPATSKTIYRIGSITKSFTAISLLQLQNQRKLKLDNDISTYLNEFKIGYQKNQQHPILIKEILTHTSGLPSDIYNGFFCDTPPNNEWLIKQSSSLKTSEKNGTVFAYSNLGYGLLGEVIKRQSSLDYESYLKKNIFEPLNMNTTFVTNSNLTVSKSYFNGQVINEPLIRDASAGLIHSSVEDMSNYLLMFLNNGGFNGNTILDSLSIAEMEKNQVGDLKLKTNDAYGYALFLDNYTIVHGKDSSSVKIIGHAGDTYSFHADFQFIPELNVGAVILTNTQSGTRINSCLNLLKLYLKLSKKSVLKKNIQTQSTKSTNVEKGWYAITNLLVEVKNPAKIVFKQGPAKIILKPSKLNPEVYAMKAVLFGIVPIKIKDQGIQFELIEGEFYVKGVDTKNNSFEYIGKKVTPVKIPENWVKSYGKYEIVNVIDCKECVKMKIGNESTKLLLSEESGVLKFSFSGKNSMLTGDLFAVPEDNSYAISIGVGRGKAETIRILENGDISYSGFEFRKIVSK